MATVGAAAAHLGTVSIWEQIQECALESPEREALIEPGLAPVTYERLWETLEDLTDLLRQAGIGAADTVAVLMPDGVCVLMAILGTARLCACAPLNVALTATELEADLSELGATAVIVDSSSKTARMVAQKLKLMIFEAVAAEAGCEWRRLDEVASAVVKAERPPNGEASLILHTSATTGSRKLVPISASNLQAMVESTKAALRLTRDDRVLMMARVFHTQGILSPFAQLLAGGSVIAPPGFEAQSFRKWLEELRPTWYTCGPTLHHTILANLKQNPLPVRTSLRLVRSGGSPLPAKLRIELSEALQVPVLDVYGLSETGGVACTTPELWRSGELAEKPGTVGRSMGAEIGILGANSTLLPVGNEGEVVIRGAVVMAGYLNNDAANREAFVQGWFRTGDLGRLDEEGFLFITGRLKEMVNRGGQKIIPNEVDAAFLAHEAVVDTAAFGVPHPTLGDDIACAVVLREGFSPSVAELREFAAKTLAAYKVPRGIYPVDKIPRGATGKPQRLVLRERFVTGAFGGLEELHAQPSLGGSLSGDAPASSLKVVPGSTPIDVYPTVDQIWCRYLKTERARENADFFLSGGDSLSAATMLAEVETLLGLERSLPQADFFPMPTLTRLKEMVASILAGRDEKNRSSQIEVVPIQAGKGALPLFMFPADGEEGSRFRRLSGALGDSWPVALVRPQNSHYKQSVSWVEDAGVEAAAAVRASLADGSCVLGGYCSGGVIAFEAARRLQSEGLRPMLILFDVPMPGFPNVLRDWRVYLRATMSRAKEFRRDRRIRPLLSLAGRMVQRTLWLVLRRVQPKEGGLWGSVPLRWLCAFAQRKYFSFYRPVPVDFPILHLMARDEGEVLLVASRLGWDSLGVSEATTKWIPGDHVLMLTESNVALIAECMTSWISSAAAEDDEIPEPAAFVG